MNRQAGIFVSLSLAFSLLGIFLKSSTLAQTREAAPVQNREEIVARAKQEGKLSLVPGYDKSTIAPLVSAFKKKYPFIDVSWQMVTGIAAAQRQLFDLAAGKTSVDVFSPSTAFLSEYFKQDLIKKYDLKGMAQKGQIKIPTGMIDESGDIVWLGSNVGVFVYNTKQVSADQAPKRWGECLDPKWKGKIGVDTKPNTLTWLIPAWGEEKVLGFARSLKANDPVWVRGQTGSLARMAGGEFIVDCSMYLHTSSRYLKKDPTAPIKIVIPEDIVGVSFHEPEAIYARAQNPHAGLLWIEFVASKEGQALVDTQDPGKASFLGEDTLAATVMKGHKVSICGGDCRNQEEPMMGKIAVQAWGLPKVGQSPK
ncbi:MAG: ABC transporter substrate-binding protein [Candidatus Binatia bacterium]